jgi:ATP-dependent RNA helicase DDX18/HAS1
MSKDNQEVEDQVMEESTENTSEELVNQMDDKEIDKDFQALKASEIT